MRADLCARWDNEWALLECRVKASEMLGHLYDAWRDAVSQADDLRKQRDEARLEVARLNEIIEDIQFRANSYLDEDPYAQEALTYVCEPISLKITYI